MARHTEDETAWYYRHAFPYVAFTAWLTHDSAYPLTHREFAFNNCQWRYQQFDDARGQLKAHLCQKAPERFDVGPVYSVPVKQHGDGEIVERELVFDIDLNDYGTALRTCCGDKKQLCEACWPYLVIAARVLHVQLTRQLGFEHIRYVFSGRRGLHIWVSDASARSLSDSARKWLVQAIQATVHECIVGAPTRLSEGDSKMTDHDDDSLWRTAVVPVMRQWFDEVLLTRTPHLADFSALMAYMQETYADWPDALTSCTSWRELVPQLKRQKLDHLVDAIVCRYAYPRCDTDVTKRRNHLLKAPYCVHPATKMLCVPMVNHNPLEWDACTLPPFPSIRHLCAPLQYPAQVAFFKQSIGAL
jgi:DNA primase small subunit